MTPSSQAGGTRAPTRGVTCPPAPGGFAERSGEAGLPRFLLGGSTALLAHSPLVLSLLPRSLSRETSEQTADSTAGTLASELGGAWPCPSPAGDLQEVIYSPCL